MSTNQEFNPDVEPIREFSYQFNLYVDKVYIPTRISGAKFFQILWGRKRNGVHTKNTPSYKPNDDFLYFNEKLSMITTCKLDTVNKKFMEKDT